MVSNKPIYILLSHLAIGGIEICVTNLANALVRRGYDVHFICMLRDNQLEDAIDPRIKVEYLTDIKRGTSLLYKLKWRLLGYRALGKWLSGVKDSIIISTRNEFTTRLSSLVSRSNTLIAQLHHDYFGHEELVNDFKNKYQNIDYFVVLTEDIRTEISELMNCTNNHTKVVTIPNFYPGTARYKASISSRGDYAIAIGRLASEKGFLRLIELWKMVVQMTNGYLKLYIVGEGEERQVLENKIVELGLDSEVKLLGRKTNDEAQKMASMAVTYCMSSYTEAFSIVLLESLNIGIPQIAFDVRVGPRNLMHDKVTGYLVKDGDLEMYAKRVVELFYDKEKWEEMSIASINQAAKFREDAVLDKWEKLISGI